MKKWVIDPDHSVAAFFIKHLMIANVRGQFNKIVGTIQFDADNISMSSVEVSIDAAGIYTGIQKRDDHLKSADFFDTEKHPNILFKSKTVESSESNHFKITGELSIHGIKKSVILNASFLGPEKSPFGGETTLGFAATTTIHREDFELMWNEVLESGGVLIGKEVQIMLDIEADLVIE
jgi:polyisoprenoid-binding protein YceI